MTPYVVSTAVILLSGPLAIPAARIAGLESRAALGATAARRGADVLRALAAFAALPLLVGATGGDLLVAGVLLGAALGRRAPAVSLALVLVASAGALRVGSTAMDDITGAHRVLGSAITSPAAAVALASACAALACLAAAAALVPAPRRAGRVRDAVTPGALTDAVAPIAVILLGVVVAVGPPLVDGEGSTWSAARGGGVVMALVGAAAVRRIAERVRPGSLESAAAVLGAAAVVLALVAR